MPRRIHHKSPRPLDASLLGDLAARIADMNDTFTLAPIEHHDAPYPSHPRARFDLFLWSLGCIALGAAATVAGAYLWKWGV